MITEKTQDAIPHLATAISRSLENLPDRHRNWLDFEIGRQFQTQQFKAPVQSISSKRQF